MARPFIQKYSTSSGGTRYRAWYYDAVGRKVGPVFHAKREAEAFLNAKAAEEATGTLADTRAGQVTFEHVWNERRSREQFAANTLASQDNVWRVVGPLLGRRAIGEIQSRHVEAALASIEGPAARAKARSVLVAVFSYAIAERRITMNPAKARRHSRTRAARMASQPSVQDERRYLNDDQLRALVAAMPDRYQMLVELMGRIGLRPGEAYALTVGQFDTARGEIRVDRTVDGPATKTGKERTVVLPIIVADGLIDHIRRYSRPEDPSALIFPNSNGRMLDRNQFRHVFQRASLKAGVNHGLAPNHLRHTAVAYAIAHGANVYDVQNMVGQAKASITLDVYGYLWDKSPERLAQLLDQAIRGG